MNLFPERSKCLNEGYLFSELFFGDPKVHNLLPLASMDYSVGMVPKEVGNASRIFLLMIKYFNELN